MNQLSSANSTNSQNTCSMSQEEMKKNEEKYYFINLISFKHRNHNVEYKHSEEYFKSTVRIKEN